MLTLQRTLSLRQALRHPTRTGLMVLSIALGVAAWITTSALDRTLGTTLRQSATPLAGLADLQVSNGDLGVRRALAERLATIAGVRSVRPVLIQRVLLPDLGGRSAVLVGVDLAMFQREQQQQRKSTQDLADELGLSIQGGSAASFLKALLLRESPVLVGGALARELPRDGVRFNVLAAGRSRRVTRVGTIEARGPTAALGGHVLLTDLRIGAELTGRSDRVSRLDVLLAPGADRARVRARLEAALEGAGQVVTPEASDRRVAEALAGLRIGFSLCGFGALGLGLFLMASVLGVVAAERRGEVGALRALGADRGQIWRLCLGEAALLGALGGVLGIPLGWGLARLGLGPMLRALSDIFLPLEAQDLELDARTVIGGLIAGMITTLLASLVPAARAAMQTPLEAMSREPADASGAAQRRLRLAALALLVLGAACFASGQRLAPPIRVYGTLLLALLGTLLALPTVAAFALRRLRPIAEAALGLSGRLAADHLIRTPGRSGFVIAALAGAMALILQTGGVIHGNAEAVRDWIDRCVMGDLFVTSGGPLSASGQILPMRDELGPEIEAAIPGSLAVPMRFHMLPWQSAGRETRVRLLVMDAPRYVAANRDRRPAVADLDLYRRLAAPGNLLISENFAALYGIKPGAAITLPGAQGPVTLRVAGTIADFSCSRGTVVVDRVRYGALFEGGGVDVFSVFRPAQASLTLTDEASRRRIEQAPWASEQALCVLTRPELRRHVLGMIDRLYLVAYLQEIVAAVVAALGVATTLLISLLQRKRELGLLRALGATPGQALQLVLTEAVLLTLLGLAFGLLLGVALEWYVLRVVLLEESGFVFPVRFPWSHAALVAALVALSGGLAGLGPAISAARLKIHEAIAFE